MTGAVRHQENANRARMELATVKEQASELIGSLVVLIKHMAVFADNLDGMNFDGRPVMEIVADLTCATSASEMLAALQRPEQPK
jgi:hypothetical protein